MEKIKELRKEVGMSRKQLSDLLQVGQHHYTSLENCLYGDKERVKDKAVEILYPLLIKKIISKREELESLENFSLQFKS